MKKQKKLILLAISAGIGYANAASSSQLQIKQVIVGPQTGDKPTNFSINVSLINNYKDIDNWQFGFYMPRNFRKTSRSNLNLTMKICDNTNQCASLSYQKAKFTDLDLSTVFTTIVKPQGKYPLQKGKKYQISLLHNSSSSPQNYASFPQNFFITDDDSVINLATNYASYNLTSATNKQNQIANQKRISNNWSNSDTTEPVVNIIPMPTQVTAINSSNPFILDDNLAIHNLAELDKEQLKFWQQALKQDHDLTPDIDNKDASSGIILNKVSNSKMENPEGYDIEITAKAITINASNDAGFFYALQSLRQLWFKNTAIPSMTILDTPKFKYRGILLDVARHYFTPKELKNFIDVMATSKLNTLHLHLSDDEAFRLELDNYSDLAKKASHRGYGQLVGPMAFPQKNLGKTSKDEKVATADSDYGGSYSSDDIRDLIKYANSRQITIIPEIDIPGHSRAMMKAMPEAFYEPEDHSEYAGYGDDSIPVCAYGSSTKLGKKFTSAITGILNDTANLFSNQTTLYATNNEVSIGGDEVFKGTWENAPSCQTSPWNSMSETEKEHYFLGMLNDDAKVNKLKLSGWHEFLIDKNGNVNNSNVIANDDVGHVWVWNNYSVKSSAIATKLANANYPVVLDYSDYLYMNMTYNADIHEPGFYGDTKFSDTNALLSSVNPVSKTLKSTKHPEQILGIEGALWTDIIPSYSQLQYMAFPKIAGLAEAAWSYSSYANAKPQWQSLASRLGCGKTGFLAYLNQTYSIIYRGYPNGIKLEAPLLCN